MSNSEEQRAAGEVDKPDEVDRFVRSFLDRETERTDASRLVARIHAQWPLPATFEATAVSERITPEPMPSNSPVVGSRRPAVRSTVRWLAWSVVTAAAVLVAFCGGRYLGPVSANADTLLRHLQSVHSGNVDRCYRVQYAPDPRYWDGKNKLDGPSESVMWTRGDRFWSDCAIGNVKLLIGCEEDGTLWVSSSPKKGIRFADRNSQLPQEVAMICAVNAMTVPALVNDVLADFDLQTAEPASSPQATTNIVWARLKPEASHPLLSAALLEIDAETNVLVRLVLWTMRDDQPRGTVTYTLLESGLQSDDQYRLKSHLDVDAEIQVHRFGKPDAETSASRGASNQIAGT